MTNLVRGVAILLLMGIFVVFIYAQGKTGTALSIANDSHPKIENTINNQVKDKPLVKTTGLVSAARAASRGSFMATAYCLKGRTALGHGVRRGIIAADPRVLKLGSTIFLGAGSYTGQYLVSDTGGAVKGRKIDIWMPSCSEARRFGRRSVNITMAGR